jgi:cell division protein ZapA (FtsZ GTPase activity inhibitor)
MTKAKILLVLAFIVVCAAGVVVGTAVDRHAHPDIRPVTEPGPAPELGLNHDQQEKLHAIWEPVIVLKREMFGNHRRMEQQRLEKILALLTPEQKAEYVKIQADIDHQNKDVEDQIRLATQKAEAATHELLTPAQLKKLDALRHQHMGHGMGPPDMGGPPPVGMPGMGPPGHHHEHGEHHRNTTRPTTLPATTVPAEPG